MERDYVIKLGTMLFTMVEPQRATRSSTTVGTSATTSTAACSRARGRSPAIASWPRATLKDLRYPAESPMTPDPLTGSYLAIYWVLDGHHDEWNRWSVDTVQMLHATGRMFAERTHIHTVLYDYTWSIQSSDRGTSAELALDRNYPGLVVNVGELAEARPTPTSRRGPATRGRRLPWPSRGDPDLDRATRACSRCSTTRRRTCRESPTPIADSCNCTSSTMRRTRTGPRATASSARQLNASGVATHLWTAPWIQTVFGTDNYTDQLW